jgi:hypothetical protein
VNPRSRRLFGLPRWAVLGALAGVVACVVVVSQRTTASGDVRAAVEGFRHSSVYVEQGAPPVVNPDRVRQVLGDRPIVVAILADKPLPVTGSALVKPRQRLCDDIAGRVPTNIVILFAGDEKAGYGSSFCTGPRFSNEENPVPAGNFDLPLIVAAETSWKYRVAGQDLTPEVEEYVLAFDAQAAKDYPRSVPRRAAVPDELATGEVVLSLGGIVAACVALFFLLHLLAGSLRRRPRRDRLALEARLSRIGDRVLHGDPQDPDQAEISRKYVLALRAVEHGGDAEQKIIELEDLVS